MAVRGTIAGTNRVAERIVPHAAPDRPAAGDRAGLPVPVAPAARARSGHGRPADTSSALLAQLIATRLDMPQTRRLRRAPADAAGRAYAAADDLDRGRPPSRSILL